MPAIAPDLWSILKTKMAYASARQEILAGNVANADTPKYKPKDLKPLDFDALVNGGTLAPAVTNSKHISGGMGSGSGLVAVQNDNDLFEVTPVGNGVTLEDQMMKAAENRMQYQMSAQVYKKLSDLMKLALGNR